jgi:zinc/manganese transport system ATP-binding protein
MHVHRDIVLEGRNLVFAYGADEAILKGDSFEFRGPGLVTILGPNGSGKTTFFKVLLGLLKPQEGRVLVSGVDVTGDPVKAGRFMSYVPQLSSLRRDIPVTPLEVVEAVLRSGGLHGRARREAAVKLLEEVGVSEVMSRTLGELSGGQLQRVLIARALARDTDILLLDEPLSGVDPRGREDLLELVREIAQRKLIVMTTHDLVQVLKRSDYFVVFNRGIVAQGSPYDIYKLDILRKAYGTVLEIEKCLHVL